MIKPKRTDKIPKGCKGKFYYDFYGRVDLWFVLPMFFTVFMIQSERRWRFRKELFDQIMSIDHRANELLNEAVRRKEEAVRKVLEEKQKLSQQMEESAQNYLSDMEAAEKSNAQEQMQLCKERAEQEKDRLEQVYREKRETWVAQITDSVLGRRPKTNS